MRPEQLQIELFRIIDGSNNWQSLQHLMLKLEKEDSEKVLDGLLSIFFSSQYYRLQAAAGGLLWVLKPKYKRNLREDIQRSLQNWDVSIEELPWYFAEVMGVETVREQVRLLLTETLDEISRKKAETYLYWLSVSNPEAFRAKLNRDWNRRLQG